MRCIEFLNKISLNYYLSLFKGFIVLPTAYLIITRKNVFIFMKNMSEALLIAFATASRLYILLFIAHTFKSYNLRYYFFKNSAATLPITFRCIEEKNKVPKMISRFVLPVGATVNLGELIEPRIFTFF